MMSKITLYTADAPNPHIVDIFVRLAGIDINEIRFDLDSGENRSQEFLAKNATGQVPLLELECGTCITEVPAICEYLAEAFPEANLASMGNTAVERAEIRMWLRKIDLAVCEPMENSFRFSLWADYFKDKIFVSESAAPGLREQCEYGLVELNKHLADKQYIAVQRLSFVDIFLFAMLRYFFAVGFELSSNNAHVHSWYQRIESELGDDIIG